MLDLKLSGGTVVDGTGGASQRAARFFLHSEDWEKL